MTTQKTAEYIQIGDGKLYYETAGEGETLVLCHAGFVDSRMWDDQWAEFTRHYRVIRFDMRGYGKSDPAKGPVARHRELYQLLTKLGIKHAHLLGCSLSGTVVMDVAVEHPELVQSLTVVSATPSGFELQGEPPKPMLEMIGAVQQGDLARVSELQLQIWIDGPFRQPDQVDPRVRQRAAEMNQIAVKNGTWAVADSQPIDPLDPPAVARLDSLHMPILIIAGALDHPEILRAADVMEKTIKGAKKVILPNSAHLPNMEKPTEFNQAVLSFLQKMA